MKSYVLTALLLGPSLFAQSLLTYHGGQLTTENGYVMEIQRLDEIVGGKSPYHELRYGAGSIDVLGASRADIYLFGYTAPDKNNEVGFGLGGTIASVPFDSIPKLTLKLGGSAGYGWQSVKGKSTTISTRINKLSYVTTPGSLDALKTPTKMSYEDDTSLLLMTLVTGFGYDLNSDWRIDGEFSYRAAYYQFAYRNEGSGILNSFTETQDQWISTIGLSYRF